MYQTIARIAPSASAPRGRDFTELDTHQVSMGKVRIVIRKQVITKPHFVVSICINAPKD